MLRLSGTCVLARLACPPSQEIQQHLTKISKIKREKKKKKTHISCKESAVAQSSLHSLKLLFCCLSLLFPSYYSANCSKAYFFCYTPSYLWFQLLNSKTFPSRKSRRWHILPDQSSKRSSWQHMTTTLLFANFELHCDSYTFSLRLNLKQLKLEKILILNHCLSRWMNTQKNISQRSVSNYFTKQKRNKAKRKKNWSDNQSSLPRTKLKWILHSRKKKTRCQLRTYWHHNQHSWV